MDRTFFRRRPRDRGVILDALAVRYGVTPAQIASHPWSTLLEWCEWAGLNIAQSAGNAPAQLEGEAYALPSPR